MTHKNGLLQSASQHFLPVLLLALSLSSLHGQETSSSPYKTLKQTLAEALKESQSLEQQLTSLQADNERLLTLSNQQATSLQTLSDVQTDLQTLLQQQSTLLTSSNRQAAALETRLQVTEWVAYLGVPVAIAVGFALSWALR